MFDNVLGQPAVQQIIRDRDEGALAPSMLFSGPAASGKGTAGLELARILSCEDPRAPWNCACSACTRHRFLNHPDLLILGSRSFSAEICAATAAFLREPELPAARLLFIRAVRKLLVRFFPMLWEEDMAKLGKLSAVLLSLEEDLDGIWADAQGGAKSAKAEGSLHKCCDSILKNALKLESAGISDFIPIGHVRRAAYWCRLAPTGKGKLLLIENADRMQDGARNSLLKILEEPPESVHIVLTTAHEEALLPTVLSRLRPYRFRARSPEEEAEVLRRVFRAETQEGSVRGFLDSFLPVSGDGLRPLAAYCAASIALGTAFALRGLAPLPEDLVALGKYTVPISEAAGLGRPDKDTQVIIAKLNAGAEKFEVRGLFAQFLAQLLSLVSDVQRTCGNSIGGFVADCDTWRRLAGEAATAVGVYNQTPALALERFITELKRDFCKRALPRGNWG
jgi:DNA polymerase-3 subunit gamma/tau